MRFKTTICLLFIFSVFDFNLAFTEEVLQTKAIVDEIRWLKAESFITIATKHEISLSKAPGIATVITAKEIKQRGFRTVSDILKTVPGFDIHMDTNGEYEFIARGVENFDSSNVKLLIDGHSVWE